MEIVRKETERIDDLQRNGLKIIQDSRRFCFGMDAVLLSGFAYAGEGDRVCDFGTGTGMNINQLYILEKPEDSWELRAWDYDTVLSALNDRIRYKYADDYQTMELFDRDKLIGTVFMGNRLKEANEKFENISYGDLLTIELIHGKPWLTFSIGLLLSNRVMPDYDIPMNITAPLLFENGQVIIGNMTMQSFYTPSGEEEWIAQ